jgi:hypothetical protein
MPKQHYAPHIVRRFVRYHERSYCQGFGRPLLRASLVQNLCSSEVQHSVQHRLYPKIRLLDEQGRSKERFAMKTRH